MRIRIITLLLLITLSLNGAIYYVAPTGGNDSNAGTNISAPWATWQKAFLTAVAGDTVYFRGGVWEPTVAYSGNNICLIRPDASIGHNGEPGNPISYLNYPGETPILDCHLVNTGGAFITGLQLEDVHFVNWRGLTIRNIYQRVQYVEAGGIRGEAISNMNWERIDLYNIGGHGWYVESDVGPDYTSYDLGWDGSGYIPYDTTTYLNCDTWQCADTLLVNNAEGQSPGNMGDGFKHINGGAHITYTGCRAWHCADDGFDMPGFGVTILRNCWSFANGIQDASWEGNGFKFGASDIVPPSPRRILTNCISAYNVNGVGFFNVEYDGYHRDMARVHNVVSYMDGTAFALNDNTTYPNSDTEFRNCYAYKTVKTDPGGRPNVIEANCYYIESNNNWDYAIAGSLGRWDWATDIIVSDADFVSVDSTSLMSARSVSGQLPDINFLKLNASSDLVNTGVDVGLSYSGNSPDVGVFERYNKKTVFIHHSSGGNWVADAWGGLGDAMNDAGYFFSGIDYTWTATQNVQIGDYTDIGDWWTWFMDQTVQGNGIPRRDNIMNSVYVEYDKDIQYGDYTRTLSDPGGENEIIMFKSCYPNSDILADNATNPEDIYGDPAGSNTYTETNVRALYDTILTYFKANPGRMFVVITAPPLSSATNAARARSFNNWLVYDWLQDAGWENKNVYVWDWYNVLTDADNHHRVEDGVVVHTTDPTSGNTAIYIDGDDHPNAAGCQKSTAEFVPVLDIWYDSWANYVTPPEEPQIDSTLTDILGFTLPTETGAATINTTNHTVAIEVSHLATVTNLTPYISLSYGATISPTSMTTRDFTNPLTYTVTALDGTTTQVWTVTVTQEEEPYVPPEVDTSRIIKYHGGHLRYFRP